MNLFVPFCGLELFVISSLEDKAIKLENLIAKTHYALLSMIDLLKDEALPSKRETCSSYQKLRASFADL